jgi:multidrug efflux pump subunit AcrA (membrane-fusion protein)
MALAVLTLVALMGASCTNNQAAVDLGTAARGDVVELVDAPATVTARAVATLSAPADGTLAALYVAPGAQVGPGQMLALVDSPTAQQRLADARRALDALRSGGGSGGGVDLSGAQRRTDAAAAGAFAAGRDAATKIVDPTLRAVLLGQVDAAEKAYREAAASARALISSVQRGLASVNQAMGALTAAQRTQAQAAYNLAQSTVDALTLRAPVAGVVQLGGPAAGGSGALSADATAAAAAAAGATGLGDLLGGAAQAGGQNNGPGVDPAPVLGGRVSAGTPLLTVVDTGELGLLAAVDETDVLLVQPGVTAGVELDAAAGATYRATVRSVDVLPGASARGGVSYRVRLSLAAGRYADGRAAPVPRPGMSAVAHLEVRSATGAVVVPAAAVFNAEGRDAVWVVRDGKAQRAPVTIGVAGQDLVQVVGGLAEGDRIVVRGADQVRAGQQVP